MSSEPRPIRVLHVDDEPDFADMVATFLEREDDRFEVHTAGRPDEGLDRLGTLDVDCVVSDYDMPGTNGIEFLEAVREEHGDLPFVLFTGKGSEEVASEAISAGVTDYLQKETGSDQYTVLANRIGNAVSQRRAESSLETRVRQQRAVTDLGQRALSGAEVETLFEEAADAVADALDTELAGVFDYRTDRGSLLLRAGVGWHPELPDTATVDAGLDSLAGYTLRSENPVIAEDVGSEERFDASTLLRDHGIASSISVIVGEPDEPWGVLGAHATDRTRFTEEDVTFVQSVANVLANAIERAERERELRRNERRFDAVFEDPNILVGLLAPDGTVLDINRTAMEYVDADLEAVTGVPFWETPWWRDDEAISENVERWVGRAAAGEYVEFEADLTRSDGSAFSVNGALRPVTDGSGEVVSLIASARDVTERERHERELEAVRDRMEFALDATDSYVFVIDLETGEETRYGNFERVHGIDRAEVPTSDAFYERAVHPEDRETVSRAERAVTNEEGLETIELEYRTHPNNGPVRWIRSEGFVRSRDSGSADQLIGLATDVTERKRHERELERQNERLEEFASVVSHDLRSPLTVAETHLAAAGEECDSDHLEGVERAHERVRALTDELLTLAREGETTATTEPLALASIVERSWENVETGNATLVTATDRRIRADEARLLRLFENLVRNAVEHGGDDVTVRVGDLPNGFYVEDDGPGIPPDRREQVFEAAFTTAPEGTGFGLSIVKQIAETHVWDVGVAAAEGGGARFEITGVEFADG